MLIPKILFSQLHLVLLCVLVVYFGVPANSRIFSKWTCLAESASNFNTSHQTPPPPPSATVYFAWSTSVNYGIFKINNKYWCYDYTKQDFNDLNGCGINCTDLLGEDVKVAVECAHKIFFEHGFNGWSDWTRSCSPQVVSTYLSDCIVIPGQKPPVITSATNKTFVNDTENQYLSCDAVGVPPPDLTWNYNKILFPDLFTRVEEIDSKEGSSLKLFFPRSNFSHAGKYSCTAENLDGKIQLEFKVDVVEAVELDLAGFPFGLAIGIPFLIFVLTAIGTVVIYRKFFFHKDGLTAEEIKEFQEGDPSKITKKGYLHENIQFQPYNKEHEVVESTFKFDESKVLGSGQYGIVMIGELNGAKLAVKTVKPHTDKLYVKALLSELKIMSYLGKHDGIVNLIGAKTTALNKGQLYILVELCELGDLGQYLRQGKPTFVNLSAENGASGEPAEYENTCALSTIDLFRWSTQIAAGMQYLAEKKVIHGDLATRNILLTDRFTAKITDFGLSRQLYDYTNYVKKQQVPLPWRWMSLEALREMSFSTYSDVWSFGVTLWEIFSLGDVPYAGLSWTLDFVPQLEDGLRLIKPKYAPNNTYTRMLECWSGEPQERPSFELLHHSMLLSFEVLTKTNANHTKL